MNRRALVLVPVGGLLLVGAALLPTVVAPRLESVPADPDVTTTLLARDAQVFDTESISTVTRDLTLTSSTRGYQAGEEPDDGVVRSQTWEVGAFEARSGEASACCEGFRVTAAGASEPVVRSGQALKMPFGTEPVDHSVWDPALGEAVTATFQGETTVDGVLAYEFRSVVPPTDIGPTTVPSSVVGIVSVQDVVARQVYAGERTIWVEPHTGGVLDVRQHVRQTLEHGDAVVVAMDATFELSPESRAEAVEQLRRGVHLGRMRDVYPLVAGVAGLVLVLGGLVRRRRYPA
jgi:hypothetical protein